MHVNVKPKQHGFSLVELMTIMTIISIIALIAYTSTRDVLTKSSLTGQMVTMKNAIQKARLRAIERNATVQVTMTDGRFLALVDLDRGGVYGEDASGAADPAELIYGNDLDEGADLDVKNAEWVETTHPAIGSTDIDHPSGAYDIQPSSATGYSTFPNDIFFISPAGLIRDDTGAVVNGTVFMRSTDDKMVALIHVSAVGEVRTAIKEEPDTEWTWQ